MKRVQVRLWDELGARLPVWRVGVRVSKGWGEDEGNVLTEHLLCANYVSNDSNS